MLKFKKASEAELYPDNRFMSFGRIVVTVLMLIFMSILTFTSLLGTTGMKRIEEAEAMNTPLFQILPSWESVIYYSDSLPANLIWLALCGLLIFLLMPLLKKIPLWVELAVVAVWTITLGTIWIYSSQSAPSEDSYMVTTAAWDFATNFYNLLGEDMKYFRNYSFQLGYVFFNEMIMRVALSIGEVKNLLFLEVINVVLLSFSYVGLILINSLVFKDQRVRHVTAVLFMFAAQPIIFCSFLYGIIPGITFAIYGILFMILYFKKNRLPYGLLSAVFTAIAVMIKSNNNIVLVAICCMAFVMMFRRKKFIRDIIYIAVTLSLSLSITPAVKASYEKRAGVDLGDALPYTAWFAMGLNEASNAPGWYGPAYTVFLFDNNNRDPKATSKAAMEVIKDRVKYFKDEPQYRHEFFYKKFISQWNETSYQSVWNNTIRYNYEPRHELAENVCVTHVDTTKRYMDIYAQLIFVGVLIGLFACLKNKNFLSISLPLVILGGMLYHLLAEAKSQYAMPYFILMIGFSAYGICTAYDVLEKRYSHKGAGKLIFYPAQKCTDAIEAGSIELPDVEEISLWDENTPDEKEENSPEKDKSAEEKKAPEKKNGKKSKGNKKK